MTQHSFKTILITSIVCMFVLSPIQIYAAGTKLIGETCESDGQCGSNECEDSSLKPEKDGYCVCNIANDCAKASPVDNVPANWNCKDGNERSRQLNYCLHKTNGPVFAVTPATVGILDLIFDTTAAAQIQADELKDLIARPTTKITIPGLTFSKLEDLEVADSEDGNVYPHFPFLGQYIAASYKYLIIIAGLIATVMIIRAGLVMVLSAGSSEKVTHAKTIILRSLIGLFLAVTSYSLLFLINPELVSFRSLRIPIQYTAPDNNDGLHNKPEKLRKCTEADKALGYTKLSDVNTSTIHKIQQKNGSADCSQFAPCIGGAIACRAVCISQLKPSQKTKIASYAHEDPKATGLLDCSTKSNTRGAAPARTITTIGLHQGRVDQNTVLWWWLKKFKKIMLQGEPSVGIGTHYYINGLGQAIQLMDERFVANHGVQNKHSIGIDINPTCRRTERWNSSKEWQRCRYNGAQIAGLNKLIENLRGKYGNLRVVPHCSAGGSNHTDPWNFDYTTIDEKNGSWYNPPLNASTIKEGLIFSGKGRCLGLFVPPKQAPSTIYGCCDGTVNIQGSDSAELETQCYAITQGRINYSPGVCSTQSTAPGS